VATEELEELVVQATPKALAQTAAEAAAEAVPQVLADFVS
jgi:hypothetical protein